VELALLAQDLVFLLEALGIFEGGGRCAAELFGFCLDLLDGCLRQEVLAIETQGEGEMFSYRATTRIRIGSHGLETRWRRCGWCLGG
jgi:hypothetical protein